MTGLRDDVVGIGGGFVGFWSVSGFMIIRGGRILIMTMKKMNKT